MDYKSSRVVSLLILGVIIVTYSVLYAVTLQALHTNGHTARDLIVGTGEGGDSYQYVALAETMLTDGRFAMSATAEPESFRTPGYPLFIALVLAVFKNLAVLPLVQVVLAAFSCALIFLIGRRFFSYGIALGAAILFAIEPSVITQSFIAMSDILFTFILLGSVYVLTVWERTPRNLFFGGVLLGASALVRPMGLYVLPIVFCWILWEERAEWRVICRTGAIFLIGAMLVVVPWMTRNYVFFKHFSLSSTGNYNLFFYVREFEHQYTGKSKGEISAEMYQSLGATTTDRIDSFKFADKNSQLAAEGIRAHPFLYTAFHVYSTMPLYLGSSLDTLERALYLRGVRTGSPPPDINISVLARAGDFKGVFKALTADIPVLLERLLWLVLCIAALGMTVKALYKREPYASVYTLFFVCVVAFGLMTGPVAYSRYRLPIEPFIFILGSAGIAYMIQRLRYHYDV